MKTKMLRAAALLLALTGTTCVYGQEQQTFGAPKGGGSCACPQGARPMPLNGKLVCGTPACTTVPGMPDGDKGGDYTALRGTLYKTTACESNCTNLNTAVSTGLPGFVLDKAPGQTGAKPAVVVTTLNPGWGALPGASWISGTANARGPAGEYEYVYRFCLCGAATRVLVNLEYLADNVATVKVNGTVVQQGSGNTNFKLPAKVYNHTAGLVAPYVAGNNEIRIVVKEEGVVSALAAKLRIVAPNGGCALQ
jgi:hypothetical protein